MKITNVRYSAVTSKSRLSGDLILGSGRKHEIYFEVDRKYKDFISKDASAFLAAGLVIGMKYGENVEVDGTISTRILHNTDKMSKIISRWKLGLHRVSLTAQAKKDDRSFYKVACFFSGGVDSLYTFLKNKQKISHLIFVHGFDIKLNDASLYNKAEIKIREIAMRENVELVRVKTNIREVFEQYFNWDLSHAFALAAVSLFVRKGFREIYMSCGQTGKNAVHHYMTPELDKLWSTETMKTHHYGCSADKISKLKFLSKFKIVMETLRVCWVNKHGQYNCCECEKCFRNMLALYVSDSLEKCRTFEKPINSNKLRTIKVNAYVLKYFISLLTALKKKNDRSEIRYALEECIKNNKQPKLAQRITRLLRNNIGNLDKKYNKHRLYWFLARRNFI